jgi:hypothetical protein
MKILSTGREKNQTILVTCETSNKVKIIVRVREVKKVIVRVRENNDEKKKILEVITQKITTSINQSSQIFQMHI